MLKSQSMRKLAAEMDSLKMGMGWSEADLAKPQVMIQSAQGQSHPGSAHLGDIVKKVRAGIEEAGGKSAKYTVTDLCDGIAQGHDGMNYSLLSREMMAGMIEAQIKAGLFDGAAFVASCDKSVPAHLISIARNNMPSIFVPGGTMPTGKDGLTLERIAAYSAMLQRGEITEIEYKQYQREMCPGCGACQFMGTASTMQVMSEALGLTLPGAALMPAAGAEIMKKAKKAGARLMELIEENLLPSQILTMEAFENAVMVHAAIAGSSNALLHLPAIAHELGLDITGMFDRLHKKIPYLLNVRPSGEYSAEYFWHAGGVPRIMEEIKEHLHLDVMTVTGKSLGENLEDIAKRKFYEKGEIFLARIGLDKRDVVKSADNPIYPYGSIAILKGNLAPDGAVVKHAAMPRNMLTFTGTAVPFDSEEAAFKAVISKEIKPGDVVIIRYEGPKGSGMPEMFYTTEAIASDSELCDSVALITDGRFSGATRGPAIGHVSPEAVDMGPICLVEKGDLINIDIPKRKLNIVGVGGEPLHYMKVKTILEKRREDYVKPDLPKKTGILKIYAEKAVSPMKGGYMD